MATNTYIALASVTASGSSSVLVMNNIPQTYTDLVLVAQYLKSGTGSARLILNNDSTSLYSQTVIYGNGTSIGSGRDSGTYFYLMDYLQSSTTNPNFATIHLQNYSNTTTSKTVLERSGVADKGTVASVGLYRSTNAITRIDIADASNFAAGTTFSLYGIKAWAPEVSTKATGGYVYSDSTYYYHSFPFSGTFTPNQSLTADILVVAGGGGAGGSTVSSGIGRTGGGAGGGGVAYYSSQSLAATGYSCVVGGGGTGGSNDSANGSQGVNSQFASLTAAVGGGYGAKGNANSGANNGGSGGSGGGAGGNNSGSSGGSATSGQGNIGGAGSSDRRGSGGGGGAGAAGQAGESAQSGAGGNGTSTYSSWCNVTGVGQNILGTYYLAGGGGGGANEFGSTGGAGGYGGGGKGGNNIDAGVSGIPGTGGGGGAGGAYNAGTANTLGGNGGSGVIIIRYAK